jgi:mono/diheme cytochrome c family protein
MAIAHRHRSPARSGLMILPIYLLVWLVGLSSAQEFPADVTRGKAVYERQCAGCHGIGGWGDGPEAQSLTVRPANFHRFSSFLKSDEELQRTIEHGVVFSPMHSWQGKLTETEIRDVLEYIRLLSSQSR